MKFFSLTADNRKYLFKVLLYLLVAAIVTLIYFFLIRPVLNLLQPPTEVEYGKNIGEIIKSIAWPLIVIVAIVILRKSIATFLEKIGGRASKLSFFKIEVELATVPDVQPLTVPSLTDIKQPDATSWTTDSGNTLFEQIKNSNKADYAIIDLGEGMEWLTSRLFIFAAMLERMRGIKWLVFLNTTEGVTRSYLGMATPRKVRWCLAQNYPWLEAAYIHAYGMEIQAGPPMSQLILSDTGALNSMDAAKLVQKFITGLQMTVAPQQRPTDWVKLNNVWEHTLWINEALLNNILGPNLLTMLSAYTIDDPEQSKAKMILRRKGEFVAVLDKDRKFVEMVNRSSLVEKLVVHFSEQEVAKS